MSGKCIDDVYSLVTKAANFQDTVIVNFSLVVDHRWRVTAQVDDDKSCPLILHIGPVVNEILDQLIRFARRIATGCGRDDNQEHIVDFLLFHRIPERYEKALSVLG